MVVASTSSSLASLACYLLPDSTRSHGSPSFAYVSSSSWCRSRRNCVSLVQPPMKVWDSPTLFLNCIWGERAAQPDINLAQVQLVLWNCRGYIVSLHGSHLDSKLQKLFWKAWISHSEVKLKFSFSMHHISIINAMHCLLFHHIILLQLHVQVWPLI